MVPTRVGGEPAHTHSWVHHPQTAYRIDARHLKCHEIEQNMITTGSFLDYDGSYAAEKPYGIPTPGMASIRLYRDERRVEVVRLPS